MSGFEVVGIVFGAFPILLSAINGFDNIWRSDGKLVVIKRRIEREQFLFGNNLELLLEPIVAKDELKILLDNPKAHMWKSPAFEEGLRRRLSNAYEIVIGTMSDYHVVMERLQKEIGKSDASVISYTGMMQKVRPDVLWKDTVRKVKFVSTTKKLELLVEEVKELNEKLLQFLQHEDSRGQRLSSLPARKLRLRIGGSILPRFWKNAERLHMAVEKSWCCPCREHHTADMVLHHPREFDEVYFKVLFTASPSIMASQAPRWIRKELHIKVTEKEMLQAGTTPSSVMKLAHDSSQEFSNNERRRKSASSLSRMMQAVNLIALPPTQPEAIKDLCHTIATRTRNDSCLGALMDHDRHFSIFHKPSKAQKHLESGTLREVTFETLLRNPPADVMLENRQRHKIALAIASAYLQLHASPWIRNGWRRQDIYFWYDQTKGTLYEQPQISGKCNSSSSMPRSSGHDESIWILGIALLELFSGVSLEDRPEFQKLRAPDGQPNPVLDCAAATEWCRSVDSQIGIPLADAISWCLRHSSSRRHMELNDREWREGLLINVVEPIATCYKFLFADW